MTSLTKIKQLEDLGLGRVINTESGTTERNRLSKGIVLALRELMRQSEPNDLSRDLAAFISLALMDIYQSIDSSVIAWEKRGYWVKADRFRREWEWAQQVSEKLKTSLTNEDWATIAMLSVQVAQKFMKIKVSDKHHLGTPWVGAWKKLQEG